MQIKFDPQILMHEKYARWIIIALLFLFALLTLDQLSDLIWPPYASQSAPQASARLKLQPKGDYKLVLKSAIFGSYVPKDLDESSVQESLLNLEIVGILFAPNLQDSHVIIRAADGEEKTYLVGDALPGGAVLKKITAQGILVERDGNLESLSLPKGELTFEPIAQPMLEDNP